MERAPRVCTTCKARKKGCDKALPKCGYCIQRGLTCVYDDPIVGTEGRRNLAGRNALWDISPPFASSPFANTSSLINSPKSIEESLHHEVSDVFRITQRTFSEVCDQYFQNFHRWLPVLSQDLLVERLAKHGEQCPPADLSLLIMAMYLVTLDPSDLSKTYIIAPQTLYLEFRISFTRVQTTLTASTRLIQAGLLLAAYEYASGRPHAAYVSIGTCVRMASILGIDTYDRAPGGSSNGTTSTLKSLEIQNIYWAMIMLERLVLDECPLDNLSPALNFPDSETELPSDLVSSHHMDSPSNKIQSDQTASIGDIHASNVGSFGRQIQAISFLIQVLHNTEKGASTPLSDLIKLDEKLRGFLTVLMNQSSQRHTCGANGIVIRSLVRLHQYILKRSSVPDLAEAKIQEQSHATLDTLARMMVEVAYDHLERFVPDKIDSLPLSCSYNMRSMMELIEDRWCHLSTEDPPRGLEAFVALHDVVCKRWRPPLVPQTL